MDNTTEGSLTVSQRARVRARVRRELSAAEEEHQTGGELNLVPFLDVLINTLIFLLATSAVAAPLAHIKVTAPLEKPPEVVGEPASGGEKLFTVAIGRDGYYVAGVGGVAGDGEGPTLPCPGKACLAGPRLARYDYAALTGLAKQFKAHHPDQRRVVVTADQEVPYHVVIGTMDALRGEPGKPLLDGVSFGAP